MLLRLMLLLFALLQQLENITGLRNPGQIELGFDLSLACSLPCGRRRLGRKVLANPLGLVFLYRA
jgi:hypothetical protein